MTDGGYTQTEAWNLQLQARVDRLENERIALEERIENAETDAMTAMAALADAVAKLETAEAEVERLKALLSEARDRLIRG